MPLVVGPHATENYTAAITGVRGQPGFARSADWRVEADRILQSLKKD